MAVFSNSFTGSVAIPDANATGITNILAVSAVPTGAFLSQIKVTLNITHPFDADLDIFLIDPDGNQIELSTDNGDGGDNFINTVFIDSATTAIAGLDDSAPFTGEFRPEQALSTLYPGSINGNWGLKIVDDADADIGSLTNWSIDLSFGEASRRYVDPIADARSTVSASRDGRVSVSWNNAYTDGGVANQVYAADGSAVVAQLGVNQLVVAERDAASTFLQNGTHVLVYTSDNFGDREIFIKINSGPTFLTENVLSESVQPGVQASPMVAELSDGNLVVAYADLDSNTMQARIFNTTTNTFGAAITLSAPGQAIGSSPDPTLQPANLIALRDGGFAVTFSQVGTHRYAIFDNAGGIVKASTYRDTNVIFSPQSPHAITQLNDGSIMLIGQTPNGSFIATVLSNTGSFITGFGTLLNNVSIPTTEFYNVRATTLLDGRVMVVGSSLVEGAVAGSDIWGIVLKPDGLPDGVGFKINGDNLAGAQSAPDIATLADGRVVVTWTDHSANNGDIMQQIIDIRATGVTLEGYQSLNETWIGSRFADTFNGGLGNDAIDGGAGNDLIHFDAYDTAANVKGGADFDTLFVNNSFNFAPSGFDLAAQGFEQAQHDEIDSAGAFTWGTRTTFYSNQWVKTLEVGVYDSGADNGDSYNSTWTAGVLANFTFFDSGVNDKPYQNYTISYNASGQRVSVVGLYDNGNTYTTANDVANEAWSSVTTNFNPGGQVLFSNTSYDNGDSSVANYINGLLDSSTTYDTGADDQPYQYYTVNYNGAGIAFAVSGINNNGSPFAYLV